MRKINFGFCFVVTVLINIAVNNLNAQEIGAFRKNAISFNLTRMGVSEINISYERFLTTRRSIELSAGIVYVNDFLEDKAVKWTNNPLFSEHGYAFRFHFKFFKRKEDNSKWHDYIAPGIAFKYMYYDNREMETDVRLDSSIYHPALQYTVKFIQKRTRYKIGVEFLWGKVYEASHRIAFEFNYGAALMATISERTDYSRYVSYVKPNNQSKNYYYPSYVDNSFFVHPQILLGLKLRVKI